MRKRIRIYVLLLFVFSLAGCNPGDEEPGDRDNSATFLGMETIGGTLWIGKASIENCEYYSAEISSVVGCSLISQVQDEIEKSVTENIQILLTISNNSISGSMSVVLPDLALQVKYFSAGVNGTSVYTGSDTHTIQLLQTEDLSAGDSVQRARLIDSVTEEIDGKLSGTAQIELYSTDSDDRAVLDFSFIASLVY